MNHPHIFEIQYKEIQFLLLYARPLIYLSSFALIFLDCFHPCSRIPLIFPGFLLPSLPSRLLALTRPSHANTLIRDMLASWQFELIRS